ncbi:unnamed protein product [Symbiodinium natans]|uniref:Uncharacterized protein n=1 Tax=Symbiodinium natans TaxID=878477 RepID=A0A812K871_9DINO|nr:unnamed protein product [Symbiodinium natans]
MQPAAEGGSSDRVTVDLDPDVRSGPGKVRRDSEPVSEDERSGRADVVLSRIITALERLEVEENAPRSLKRKRYAAAMLLLSVPVLSSIVAFGVQLSVAFGRSFSKLGSLFVASSLLVTFLTTHLVLRYGSAEFKKLASRRYLICIVNGMVVASKHTLQAMAVSRMNSSIFFIVMRFALLWMAMFDALYSLKLPGLKAIGILAVILFSVSITSDSLTSDEEGMEVTMEGVFLALGCALADAGSDIASDVIGSSFTTGLQGTARNCELNRYLVMQQACSIPCYILAAAAIGELPILFRGYDSTVFFLASLPLVLKIPVFQFAIFTAGAVKTNMAVSFEMGVSYVFEVFFGLAKFNLSKFFAMMAFACVLLMDSLHASQLENAAAEQHRTTLQKVRREIERTCASTSVVRDGGDGNAK